MATLPQIRGALLEEIVLYLLEKVGYRIVKANEDDIRNGHSGLEVKGRGEWHQIDALAAFDHTPAFMYPLRLIIEAKCYEHKKPVGIEIARNSLGVLRDITENYFTYRSPHNNDEVQVQRFNYHSAIFSSSGFTKPAQNFAVAHQIFLIQYKRVPLIKKVVEGLLKFKEEHFRDFHLIRLNPLRKEFRWFLSMSNNLNRSDLFTEDGLRFINTDILSPAHQIKGSYYGMLQGKYPMHLLYKSELPREPFQQRDEIFCEVWGSESGTWAFIPRDYEEDSPNYFRLQFDLPEEIADFLRKIWGDWKSIADVKRSEFSFIDIAGKIGGVRRQVRLRLDERWLSDYIRRIKRQ